MSGGKYCCWLFFLWLAGACSAPSAADTAAEPETPSVGSTSVVERSAAPSVKSGSRPVRKSTPRPSPKPAAQPVSDAPSSSSSSHIPSGNVQPTAGQTTPARQWPPAANLYRFAPKEQRTLKGGSGEKNNAWNCSGKVNPEDQLGRLAVISTRYRNGCYGPGPYANGNYPVALGMVSDGSGKQRYEAYKVSPATTKASQFLASVHVLYYKFPDKQDYQILELRGSSLHKIGDIPGTKVTADAFAALPIEVSRMGADKVIVVAPKSAPLNDLHPLGKGVWGARIGSNAIANVSKYRIAVPEAPNYDKRKAIGGPHRGARGPRNFFTTAIANGELVTIWQGKDSGKVWATIVGSQARASQTKVIGEGKDYHLAGATSDGKTHLFFLQIAKGNGAGAEVARRARMVSYDLATGQRNSKDINTAKKGLNVVKFDGESASLAYSGGQLGLILPRTMHRSSDGLNHQGAIGVLFDAKTLEVLRNTGQTSGHSFGNFLMVDSAGSFVGVDRGDNYPRGINLHKFVGKLRKSAVVFTYKTQHGARATSPSGRSYPAYKQISGGKNTFYKWSNDNATYSRLGGVVETSAGYVVAFAGEPYQGRALNNARVDGFDYVDPRNVGMVLVRKDFEKHAKYGNAVSDKIVLSKGVTETGGFYTFGGSWSKQRNTGVVWLTNYKDIKKENAAAIKSVPLGADRVLILWEKWGEAHYVSTKGVVVNAQGRKLTPIVDLGTNVRLDVVDNVFARGNNVYVVTAGAGESVSITQLQAR